MSNRITTLCRPLRMTPAQKAVLMCLADRASDDGHAWPSVPGICEWTCLGRTAVIDAVRALEAFGYLAVSRLNGRTNRATFDLVRLEEAHQSASRTGPLNGRVRQTDGTSTPDGLIPVRQPDGTRPPAGPEASMHQGSIIEAPPQGASVPASPAGAGAGREIPQVGDAAEWDRLRGLRKTTSADWDLWARQAGELYPQGGELLNAAIRQLAENPHWKNLPGPAKSRSARGRMTLAGMDYSKGL